jgi:hypothetical protein
MALLDGEVTLRATPDSGSTFVGCRMTRSVLVRRLVGGA